MERVRPAEQGDLARCAELLTQALAGTVVRRGGELLVGAGGRPSPDELIGAWVADRRRIVLAGLFDEVVVGLAAGRLPAPGERAARVDCCYVEPQARQVGVGSALVAGLLDWFSAHDCHDVDAAALPGDRPTKQLLESAGFKARLLILHRPLG